MIKQSEQPIGIFDSGIGGTSIWREINSLLPNEHTIYLSDSKNAPYGEKNKDEIIQLSIKNTELLISKDCKMIIVACNTATTNAIKYLRANYNIPFIGIEPAIKPASLKTKSRAIGILATKGTLNSSLFEKTSSIVNNDIEIVEQVGKGIVELIEDGNMNSSVMTRILKQYLNPMVVKNCDHIVLGCTHYPYLIPQIKEIIGNNITIIDSGEAVARQTKNVLLENNLINQSSNSNCVKNKFYINNNKKYILLNILKEYPKVYIDFLDF